MGKIYEDVIEDGDLFILANITEVGGIFSWVVSITKAGATEVHHGKESVYPSAMSSVRELMSRGEPSPAKNRSIDWTTVTTPPGGYVIIGM